MREFLIIGTRTLNENVCIKIVPDFAPDETVFGEDAETLYKVLRRYLPAQTYQHLKDMLTKE